MQNKSKNFPIAHVITAFHGIYLKTTDDFFNEMMGVLAWACNTDDIWVHTAGDFMKVAEPYARDWYPWIWEIDFSTWDFKGGGWLNNLNELRAIHGETLPVWQIPLDDHIEVDPVEAAESLLGPDRVFRLDISEDDDQDSPSPYGDINWKG